MSEVPAKVKKELKRKSLQYLAIGIALYFFALVLGTIASLVFDFTYVSYKGTDIDVVTYISLGAVDLVLNLVYIFGSAILVILLWVYNFIIVEILFRGLVGFIIPAFKSFPKIPESLIIELVESLGVLRDMFSNFTADVLITASEAVEDVFDDATDDLFDDDNRPS